MSRALSANGALVLSEVNPRSANLFGGALNPLMQMTVHHSNLLPDALRSIDIHTLGDPSVFGRFIATLNDDLDRPLIIRDYSYVDYIGIPFSWPQPSESCLGRALDPFGKTKTILFVRHPADCLRSLLGHRELSTVLTAGDFVSGHLAFYDDNADCRRFRFEDFLANPEFVMEELCRSLDLPFDAAWQAKFRDAAPLTGSSRALVADHIDTVVRPRVRDALNDRLWATVGYKRLLALGDYMD